MAITTTPDILWANGDDNMGGLRTIAYYAFHDDLVSHPAPVSRSAANNVAQLALITQGPTFKPGKGWKKFYTTEDTGMVESTLQGEKDGRSFINKIKLHHPGGRANLMGTLRYMVNAGMYFIGVDAEGAPRLVGSEHWPAKMETLSITTTETAAGRKGSTVEFQCSSPYPAPLVGFAIDLESDLSGSGSGN